MKSQLDKIVESFDKFSSENAFCIADKFYTYADVKRIVASIQKQILDAGVTKHSNIGILTYDDMETYASVFAALFLGHAFVPINPLHPIDRNESIMEQAEIKFILSSRYDKESRKFEIGSTRLIKTTSASLQKSDFHHVQLPEEQNAYILFTSGSTGIPKGVPIRVKNLNSFLDAFFALGFDIDHRDRFIQFFDMTFDPSIAGYMSPLIIGACTYTVPFDSIKYMHVYKLMEQYQLTFTVLVPSILTHLRPYFKEINLEKMKYSLFCAEALYDDVTMEWSKCVPNAKIQNIYGPTEATVVCTNYDIVGPGKNKTLNGILSIGKPMKNMDAVIVDENFKPVPVREKGELCLTGGQVTAGYWKNEVRDKEAFFMHEGKRYYRTGDLAFCDEEGDIYYSGRLDFQVKINGYRVELSEIEHHAREFLKNHAVVAQATKNEKDVFLIYLFVENFKGGFTELNDYLKTKVPTYMIPAKMFAVDTFPLNANGKVDRKILMKNAGIASA